MFFFFKQKTAYEMRISDWSSDVCSSDLHSNCAIDPEMSGAPPWPRSKGTDWNLSAPLLARRCAMGAESSASTLTANVPVRVIACAVEEVTFRQMRIIGGSSDRELTALAAAPKSISHSRVVMTVTPLATRPLTSRNSTLVDRAFGVSG